MALSKAELDGIREYAYRTVDYDPDGEERDPESLYQSMLGTLDGNGMLTWDEAMLVVRNRDWAMLYMMTRYQEVTT